jgi:hypothetical protein
MLYREENISVLSIIALTNHVCDKKRPVTDMRDGMQHRSPSPPSTLFSKLVAKGSVMYKVKRDVMQDVLPPTLNLQVHSIMLVAIGYVIYNIKCNAAQQ